MKQQVALDVIFLSGSCLTVYGLALYSAALACVAAGVALMSGAILFRGGRR